MAILQLRLSKVMDGDILVEELEKRDIMNLDFNEMVTFIENMDEKSFRAKQLYEWIHKKLVNSFDNMTNIPKELRVKLNKDCIIGGTNIIEVQKSADGTRKYLIQLFDGNTVESVLMKYKHGNSVCISTQVGCRMGCKFCASTVGGLNRNLEPSEMLSQIYNIQRVTGERVSNVILMGIGEPLDNYNNVIKFIKMLSDKNGVNISQRNITLSTCGLVEKLIELVNEHLGITIAVSLHAPDDKLRKSIMPIANKYSIQDIIQACRYYIEKTGRRITFEYSLIEGINDSSECATKLARLLNGLNCHVNLIPLNPVKGRMGSRSDGSNIQRFKSILEKKNITVTIRREMGSDIDAACGQLRNKNKGGKLYESVCKD